jgi:tripartite-type tricarboxylate transporter receptor subunit TctC
VGICGIRDPYTVAQATRSSPGRASRCARASGFAGDIWVVVFAPAGMPPALVQRFKRELVEIARQPEMRKLLEADGAQSVALAPDEVGQRLRDDLAAWKKITSGKNIVIE